ncbi:10178_t:CDS:1 [Ambispora gerdemannii]|uniref:10178_t:CDS:1 n=1 Tax=Ambispora gerdemannii TaxID=144530 RepID=A0A9N8ZN08_9GLOM|nr:10178_t:CDS:1 [Ambispora gerdemannii]
MSSDAIKLNFNLNCEAHTQLLELKNENKNNKILQVILRISENPRILEILETFRSIEPFLKSTSIVRFRFTVNEHNDNSIHNIKTVIENYMNSNYDQNHYILVNDTFVDIEKNSQPTFLESSIVASNKTYNAEDGDIFDEACELDEIYYWGFRQWCTFALFYGSFLIFVARFFPSSYSLH